MLTGDESVTSGNAFVGGYSILTNLTEAQQSLGTLIVVQIQEDHAQLLSYYYRLLSARRRIVVSVDGQRTFGAVW